MPLNGDWDIQVIVEVLPNRNCDIQVVIEVSSMIEATSSQLPPVAV